MGLNMGFKFYTGVDAIGSRGGLWAAWDDSVNVCVIKKSMRFLLLKILDAINGDWFLFLMYGPPVLREREAFWKLMIEEVSQLSGPVMLIGDYNQVLNHGEKWSRSGQCIQGLGWLQDFVDKCGLFDIPSFGVNFTWSNNRNAEFVTFEKLDRAMGNSLWNQIFTSASLSILPIQRSDHSPIILDTHWQKPKRRRTFRFEEGWIGCEDVRQVTRKVWEIPVVGSVTFRMVQKQKILLRHLANWHRLSFGFLKGEIEDRRRQLAHIQSQLNRGLNSEDRFLWLEQDAGVRQELDGLLEKEELYWAQRSKQRWLEVGDRNTKFFHRSATIRSRRNKIVALIDTAGSIVTNSDRIEEMFLEHFLELFKCKGSSEGIGCGSSVQQLRGGSEVGVDPDLLKMVKSRLTEEQCQELDRPFTAEENGFVPSRIISDNIMIAHEILEFIRKKRTGKKAFFALKLDMNKAYDRVNWDFLLSLLRVMGFSRKWVGWIRQCITTVSFSILVNGQRSKSFVPTCGIRQGDPLSPYLFILVAQALSDGLAEFAANNVCRGVAVVNKFKDGTNPICLLIGYELAS
ncbi:hypothetical protein RHSIM_Rhsim08G0012400 [Rhododendron simsii]|uniref:Reverse transcriptase domain-containing protein n=1 Tax=Rhododendron simsii TaxID=118357 RepID=A0A834GL08_RHOSS|nr:hypothetical protein RHSIM_Rhsim08G0012400 [Rhododendron simsii]